MVRLPVGLLWARPAQGFVESGEVTPNQGRPRAKRFHTSPHEVLGRPARREALTPTGFAPGHGASGGIHTCVSLGPAFLPPPQSRG